MADYGRMRGGIAVSENSDYSAPYLETRPAYYTFTPDEAEKWVIEAATTGATANLGNFASVVACEIWNKDTAIDVWVEFESEIYDFGVGSSTTPYFDPGSTTSHALIEDGAAGAGVVYDSFTTANVLSGDWAEVTGATTDTNRNGDFLIKTVAEDTLTLAEINGGTTLSWPAAGADNTATLKVYRKNKIKVPAGGILSIPNLRPSGNITITSDSGTPRCSIIVAGS